MTCLCLTRNRRKWLPTAIQCFLEQTYTPRELLILADGEDVRDLVPNDDRIRYVHIEEGHQIGDKRNFGCDLAQGSVIAHWDDDDFSAPDRLADQIGRMVDSGKAVTGYNQMRFTDGAKWWLYSGTGNWALGTSLCYRKDWWSGFKFPSTHIGEDMFFVTGAAQVKQLTWAEAGDLMYATIHPGNTSPRTMDRRYQAL